MPTSGYARLRELLAARQELPSPDERRALRRRARLSTRDIAEAVGRSRSTVQMWESGALEPKGDALLAYAEVLRLLRDAAEEASQE